MSKRKAFTNASGPGAAMTEVLEKVIDNLGVKSNALVNERNFKIVHFRKAATHKRKVNILTPTLMKYLNT